MLSAARGELAAVLKARVETTFDRAALHKRLDWLMDRIERYEREHPSQTIGSYTFNVKRGIRRISKNA